MRVSKLFGLLLVVTSCAVGTEPVQYVRHVQVDPTFSIEQRIAIRQAMLNWETSTGVRFEEGRGGPGTGDITIENTTDPVEVARIAAWKGPGYVGLTTGDFTDGMKIQILSERFMPGRLEFVATHELGHCIGARFVVPASKRTETDPGDTSHCTDTAEVCAGSYMTPGYQDVSGPVSAIDIEAFNRHSRKYQE